MGVCVTNIGLVLTACAVATVARMSLLQLGTNGAAEQALTQVVWRVLSAAC
jgi:hypothetical protein